MINAAGLFIFPLFTLILTEKIGLSHSSAGIWLTVMGLVIVPANLLGGKLTDKIGRKIMIVTGQFMGGILFVLCGFMAPSMTQIYLILAACFFFGLSDPANVSIIADLTTQENREASYALSYMGFNLGFAVGPAIGGLLFKQYYAWIFWGDAITLFISVALVMFLVRETYQNSKQTIAIKPENVMEEGRKGSIVNVLFHRPVLLVFSVILLFYNFAYAQWHYLLPVQLETIYPGEGAASFGVLSSLNGLVVLVFTPVLTSVLKRYPALKRIALGGLLYLIGFGSFAFANERLWFAFGCVIFTLGEITITISYMPFIANRTPVTHRGRMNAVLPLIMGIGYTLGPAVMGRGLMYFPPSVGWQWIALVIAVGTLGMLCLDYVDSRKGTVV